VYLTAALWAKKQRPFYFLGTFYNFTVTVVTLIELNQSNLICYFSKNKILGKYQSSKTAKLKTSSSFFVAFFEIEMTQT